MHRIVLASADLALSRGEVTEALSLLKDIGEDHPYYIQAKEKMAHVYLKMRYVCVCVCVRGFGRRYIQLHALQ